LRHIEFRHPWVLYVDADERCGTDLRDEIAQRARSDSPEVAFRMRRKDYFMGRWLKHAQLYPTWFVRLFRPDRIRYERLVNPVAVVDGPIGDLEGHLTHFPFSHGISHWLARHNRYSDLEAIEALKAAETGAGDGSLWSGDPNERRRAMKDLFFRMPARPL